MEEGLGEAKGQAVVVKITPFFAILAACTAPPLAGSVDAGYRLESPVTTPGGTVYDGPPGGIPVIDRIVAEVSQCIALPVVVQVKVAPDWILNCDQTRQELPTYAAGNDPAKTDWFHGPDCSGAAWHWQSLYQPDSLVVTTPSFYDVGDPLVRLVTGRQDIWTNPHLATCAAHTTNPLDTF